MRYAHNSNTHKQYTYDCNDMNVHNVYTSFDNSLNS